MFMVLSVLQLSEIIISISLMVCFWAEFIQLSMNFSELYVGIMIEAKGMVFYSATG